MITINESDKPELPEGEYYKEDLIGFDVITDQKFRTIRRHI